MTQLEIAAPSGIFPATRRTAAISGLRSTIAEPAKAIEAFLLGKSESVMKRSKLIRLLENTFDVLTVIEAKEGATSER